MSTPLLQVRDLQVAYGHIEAVQGIGFEVHAGEIRTLVGANGAGKSTTLLALSGLLQPKAGSIRFEGEELTRLAPHQIVERGLVQVAEGRAILTTLTVRENLELGAYRRKDRAAIAGDLERVLALFPRLEERLDGLAGNLSGGEQQMLAIGRGIMARPKLMMFDEPSLGLAPVIVSQVFDAIQRINKDGTTIMLIEQNAQKALGICDHAFIMQTGLVVASGTGAELLADESLTSAYLGD